MPATSFCEYADTKPRKTPTWFALFEDRPLNGFAGIWTSWHGVRGPKSAPIEGVHQLFGFLTTDANAIVAPMHPKAMPVILTTPAEVDVWLEADTPAALALQKPLPDGASSQEARRRTVLLSARTAAHDVKRSLKSRPWTSQ
ncbi:MAG TPA: SOS response-associated peptidase family protein [Roseiarcus sp.]|nr:SOS response-associated peptidase family protein [Roseiarcus sp.]